MTTSIALEAAARSGKLKARVADAGRLDPEVVGQMWRLFSCHYEGVSLARFERDLGEKSKVILAEDSGDGSLRGFSTVQVLKRRVAGRRVIAVFSGDTIIDPDYWGQRALQRAFFRVLLSAKLRAPFTPVYWFLISKGYKTYLLLARNFWRFWPRYGRPMPSREARLLESLASEKFGESYLSGACLIRAAPSGDRVRAGLAPITDTLLEDPDVRFFAERNPRHAAGDELCCLGRFDAMTCGRAFARLFVRKRR